MNKHLSPLLLSIVLAACGGATQPPVSTPDAATGDAATSPDATTAARDPADDGDYAVTTADASITGSSQDRMVGATIFTPTGAPTGRPLVVVSPGFQMAPAQYTTYAHHLASWGFVVVLTDYADLLFPDHDKCAADIKAVITWALGQASLQIDPAKVATAGHSLGGKLSVFAATKDPRIKAVVAWDPVDSNNPSVVPDKMTSMTAALAVVGETTNGSGGVGGQACAPSAENFQQFYGAAASPALSITVTGADHMDWVDDPSCFACSFCDPGSAPADLARTVTRRLDVAWLRRQLLGDTAMDGWLDAAVDPGVTIERK